LCNKFGSSFKKGNFLLTIIDNLNKSTNGIDGLLGYQFFKMLKGSYQISKIRITIYRKKICNQIIFFVISRSKEKLNGNYY